MCEPCHWGPPRQSLLAVIGEAFPPFCHAGVSLSAVYKLVFVSETRVFLKLWDTSPME